MAAEIENRETFSQGSEAYAKHRPRYPGELFTYLASLCPSHERALDCATGNGQAAVDLAEHFDSVIGIDSSREQIEQAIQHPRVKYCVCRAEELIFTQQRFDLVTIAQALHWFELSSFYNCVKKVTKPGGIIAAWGYGYIMISDEIDKIIDNVLLKRIEPYWAPGNLVILEKYRSIEFPFEEISPPVFGMKIEWNLQQLVGYLGTWSAVKKYSAVEGINPIHTLEKELSRVWKSGEIVTASMELSFRLGRI